MQKLLQEWLVPWVASENTKFLIQYSIFSQITSNQKWSIAAISKLVLHRLHSSTATEYQSDTLALWTIISATSHRRYLLLYRYSHETCSDKLHPWVQPAQILIVRCQIIPIVPCCVATVLIPIRQLSADMLLRQRNYWVEDSLTNTNLNTSSAGPISNYKLLIKLI